jgi:hypothetical protein
LVVVVVGLAVGLLDRDHRARQRLTLLMLLAVLVGIALALGDRGPTGPAFRFVYEHVGSFRIMREPQKFSMLVALGYAAGFGLGVEWLTGSLGSARRPWAAMAGLGLALAYTPTIFLGLSGSLRLTQDISPLTAADAAMAGGPGSALVLPWHLYLGFAAAGSSPTLQTPTCGAPSSRATTPRSRTYLTSRSRPSPARSSDCSQASRTSWLPVWLTWA